MAAFCLGVDPRQLANTGRKVHIQSMVGPVAHVTGGVAKNGAVVSGWNQQTHGHQPNLQWTITSAPAGGYYIESAINPSFVLHQHGGSQSNGAPITLYDKHSSAGGNLRVDFVQHGLRWGIVFQHSRKILQIPNGVTADGTAFTQWDEHDVGHSRWIFVPTSTVERHAGPQVQVCPRYDLS